MSDCRHCWFRFFKFDRLMKYRCDRCGAVMTTGLEMFEPNFDALTYKGEPIVEIKADPDI